VRWGVCVVGCVCEVGWALIADVGGWEEEEEEEEQQQQQQQELFDHWLGSHRRCWGLRGGSTCV